MNSKILVAAILLSMGSMAHASTPNDWGHPPPPPHHHHRGPIIQKQKQYQEQEQKQQQQQKTDVDVRNKNQNLNLNDNDNTATADASNSGVSNSTTVISEAVRNAPSVSLGAVYPTAACQGGFGIGGSGVNGSGLLSISFTKKECATVVLAQNFMAIGMPETSCELLKTTKSWSRAMKANPRMRADCDRPVVVAPAVAPAMSQAPLPVTDLRVTE